MAAAEKSKTNILNLVLNELKCNMITDPDELTPEAQMVNLHYETVFDELLESNYWTFANRRIEIAADPIAPAFGWSYRYSKPTACLSIYEVLDTANTKVDYEIEGEYILCDYTPIRVRYCKRVDVGEASSKFLRAVKEEIKARCTFAATGSITQAEANKKTAYECLIEARSSDDMQRATRNPDDSDLIMVRND